MAGVYETYNDEIVTLLDAHAASCRNPAHIEGHLLPVAHDVLTPAHSGGPVKR